MSSEPDGTGRPISDPPVYRWCGHELPSREDQACPGCNELVGPRADHALAHFGEAQCLIFERRKTEKSTARDIARKTLD